MMNRLILLALALAMGSAAARSDELIVKGVRLHYKVVGSGTPVVLIHGLCSSAAINWEMNGVIKELSRSHQVLAMDLPGHGLSARPHDPKAYGVQMVEDVVALMDQCHIQKAHIVGYSLGGAVASKLISLHQDRVIRAVLGGWGWLREGSPISKIWPRLGGKDRPRGLGPPPQCIQSVDKLALTPDEMMRITVPVTILIGAKDPCRELYVAPAHKLRPDWPVRELPGAGHFNAIVSPLFRQCIVDLVKD